METLGQLKNICVYYTNQLEKPHLNKLNALGAILDDLIHKINN